MAGRRRRRDLSRALHSPLLPFHSSLLLAALLSGPMVLRSLGLQSPQAPCSAGHCSVRCPDSPTLRAYEEREQEGLGEEGPLVWKPKRGKFLLLHCARNQISNRVRCIHYHMLLAGLLNRTLLVPMGPGEVVGGYDMRIVFDVVHARHCYGYTVLTTREYYRKLGSWPVVDTVLCWRGPKGQCQEDPDTEDLNCPLTLVNQGQSAETSPGERQQEGDTSSSLQQQQGDTNALSRAQGNSISFSGEQGATSAPPRDQGAISGIPRDQGSRATSPFDNSAALTLILPRFAKQRLEFSQHLAKGGACLPLRVTMDQLLSTFAAPDVAQGHVLVVGDLVEVDVLPRDWKDILPHDDGRHNDGTRNWRPRSSLNVDIQPNLVEPSLDRAGWRPKSPASLDRAGVPFPSPAWQELPFARTPYCPSRLAVQPDGSLLQAAKAYVAAQFGGRPFAAVHWRRGDFKSFCFWHGPNRACYFPPKQVAWFLKESLERLRISEVHLTTNGKEPEVNELLERLSEYSNGTVRVSRLPSLGRHIPWMAPVIARRMERNMSLVAVMLEKGICAHSSVFFGSVASTFSQDIQRMRIGLGTMNCNDSTLCLGQKEWVRNKG